MPVMLYMTIMCAYPYILVHKMAVYIVHSAIACWVQLITAFTRYDEKLISCAKGIFMLRQNRLIIPR